MNLSDNCVDIFHENVYLKPTYLLDFGKPCKMLKYAGDFEEKEIDLKDDFLMQKSLKSELKLIVSQSKDVNLQYAVCSDCGIELKRLLSMCINCSYEKVPELREVNGKMALQSYYTCEKCKKDKHVGHLIESELLMDISRARESLLEEIQEKMTIGEHSDIFCGINCYLCARDGVSFHASSFSYSYLVICENCFLKGFFKNFISFAKLDIDKFRQILAKKCDNMALNLIFAYIDFFFHFLNFI